MGKSLRVVFFCFTHTILRQYCIVLYYTILPDLGACSPPCSGCAPLGAEGIGIPDVGDEELCEGALDWQQVRSKQKQTKPKTNIKNPTKPTEPTPKTDTKDILTPKTF